MSERQKCAAKLSSVCVFCWRTANKQFEDKFYCWQHWPPHLEKLAQQAPAKRKQRYLDEQAAEQEKVNRLSNHDKLDNEFANLTDGERQRLADAGGIRELLRKYLNRFNNNN